MEVSGCVPRALVLSLTVTPLPIPVGVMGKLWIRFAGGIWKG